MKFSKEKYREIDAKIRIALIHYPRASIIQIAEAVGYSDKLVEKRIRKIRGERARRFEQATVKEAIAIEEDFFEWAAGELWKIFTQEASPREKIVIIATLLKARADLLQVKFDAGIFERKLGEVKILTYDAALELLHGELAGVDKPAIPEPQKESN